MGITFQRGKMKLWKHKHTVVGSDSEKNKNISILVSKSKYRIWIMINSSLQIHKKMNL